jgi:hypothetical protein
MAQLYSIMVVSECISVLHAPNERQVVLFRATVFLLLFIYCAVGGFGVQYRLLKS